MFVSRQWNRVGGEGHLGQDMLIQIIHYPLSSLGSRDYK